MTARATRAAKCAGLLFAALLLWFAASCESSLAQAAVGGAQLCGISVDAAAARELFAAEQRMESPAAFTLWSQHNNRELKNDALGRNTQADAILLDGDSALVLPLGMNLAAGDDTGCLLDRKTAYALFGDENAGGTLQFDGRDYLVRGVFDAPARTVLLQAVPQGGFSQLTLERGADADAFATRHRLSPETTIPETNGNRARFFAVLPAWVAAAMLLRALLQTAWRERAYPVRYLLLLVAAVLSAAVFLWLLRGTLPFSQEFIPTRWSDFEFWGRTFATWKTRTVGLLTMEKQKPALFALRFSVRAILYGCGGAAFLCGFLHTTRRGKP